MDSSVRTDNHGGELPLVPLLNERAGMDLRPGRAGPGIPGIKHTHELISNVMKEA